ncbi:hypothetical protein COU18_02365 [Candidatus Kaiserbacteria bacterium CG10_big_fil_rev_8_21_14_0_10_51_14]|uniref:Ribulose-phosphate 3-epimerase n=1 Tax=Candidatus Kaiserbacteria bacterium CG10_big_fil_rev_8_21_14_0_10_51_14 TaxID=1974610 RepID=A0A2H0UDQ5_9BACT|nr:MAG: hypothetical protein COU18_02365 [Candidatus Kaiserbacteria bacterium CG10_big_fil_rev_8_21_14_0_10_51_14]
MKSTKIEINPTIVPTALSDIETESAHFASFASYFQIDVADGKFAPNTTWLPQEGDCLPGQYSYEVHMMVEDPASVGTLFAHAGAKRLIVHVETLKDVESTKQLFGAWRDAGVESIGVAMLLHTSFEDVEPYLSFSDFVLMMTIARIGVQGIPFEERSIERVAEFARLYPDVLIAVDGGVSEKNIADLVRAGATRFGVGSAIARAPCPSASFQNLTSITQDALGS